MTPIQRTLLAIALFLALAIGSFIWFIARWDGGTLGALLWPDVTPTSVFSDSKKSRGSGGWPPVLNLQTAGHMT